MASIEEGDGGGHKKGPGVKKAKKLSTRIDMTPMVDLGFLLITFFIFTTTMSSPTAMNLFMPKDTENEEEQNKAKQSGALTIMLGKNNQIYYYEGQLEADGSNFKQTTFKGIRKVIIDKKLEVMKNHKHDSKCEQTQEKAKKRSIEEPWIDWKNACLDRDLVVIIKPDAEATYKNTVDILDEMVINEVARYAMIDILPVEEEMIKITEESGGG